ncbi:hypothetical protein O7598_18120 [Micromonospora sp. WMMC241]|uniref:hypothetical protein n=1 Tax=Micromonospora sp. WMMC241 TaxID=3015159 RepID=UPI0022B6EACE|nr:hypothetical protein [Micromonospora sp. WMMC241]MCZ7438329.1 hypothetical protein [Micromonospora sp. WMMC241]
MIEAVISAALVKIAEGSGSALVEAIRQRFARSPEPTEAIGTLDRVTRDDRSPVDVERLRALLVRYAAEDPAFLGRLAQETRPTGATNVVAGSNVGKLIQTNQVGDVSM